VALKITSSQKLVSHHFVSGAKLKSFKTLLCPVSASNIRFWKVPAVHSRENRTLGYPEIGLDRYQPD
jgi:hypothetical protein